MNILTYLRQLFRDNDRAALEEALTTDTIRALLDVAEALRDTCIMGAAEHEDGLIIPPRQVQVIASKLALLVEEATDGN